MSTAWLRSRVIPVALDPCPRYVRTSITGLSTKPDYHVVAYSNTDVVVYIEAGYAVIVGVERPFDISLRTGPKTSMRGIQILGPVLAGPGRDADGHADIRGRWRHSCLHSRPPSPCTSSRRPSHKFQGFGDRLHMAPECIVWPLFTGGGQPGVLVSRFPYMIADGAFQVTGIVEQSDEFSG